jgi:hypothetical protein
MQYTLAPDGTERVVIHYVLSSLDGTRHAPACAPHSGRDDGQHTNDPRAATCPLCAGTAAYRDGLARLATRRPRRR